MRACLYFYDPLTVGKFASFEKKIKKKDAEMYPIVLLQYLGQRAQITPRNLLGQAGGGARNQRAAVLCCADNDLWHHQALPDMQLINICDEIIAESVLQYVPFGLLRASRSWSWPWDVGLNQFAIKQIAKRNSLWEGTQRQTLASVTASGIYCVAVGAAKLVCYW